MNIRHFALPLICASLAFTIFGCSRPDGWSSEEEAVIRDGGTVMRVLTIEDKADSIFLRTPCTDLSYKQILSQEYAILAARMLLTAEPCLAAVGRGTEALA